MSEATQHTKHWEGQVADGVFPLKQFLGETEHSAVFLTEFDDGKGPKRAAIKFIGAEAETAEAHLACWKIAAEISHPNILQVFRTGRCRIEDADLLYLVMEHAEEDLADILTQRALTSEETRDMLLPVLDALEYLHGKGFVHRKIQPSNILASGFQLKLSSDSIFKSGEPDGLEAKPGPYDPPEAITGVWTPAGDVWRLGTTLVEALTQHVPEWQPGPHREPMVPATIPAPYAEIARQCLRLEPERRTRVGDIATKLNPRGAGATASAANASAKPVAAPSVKPETRVSPAKLPAAYRPTPKAAASNSVPPMHSGSARNRPRFIGPMVAGAIVFALILTVPRLLRHRTSVPAQVAADQQPNPTEPLATAKAEPPAIPIQKEAPTREISKPLADPARPAASSDLKATSEKLPPTHDAAAPAAPSAVTGSATRAEARPGRGEVLDQVMPNVPQKARDTIQGRVRVGVKVHVDAAGAVTGAELDSEGPSKYFADLALQASKRWAFTPPEVDGKSVASEWILRFVFTQTDTKATPTQTAP